MMQLQRKVKVEKFFGGANRKEKKPLVITDVPKDFDKDKEWDAIMKLNNIELKRERFCQRDGKIKKWKTFRLPSSPSFGEDLERKVSGVSIFWRTLKPNERISD